MRLHIYNSNFGAGLHRLWVIAWYGFKFAIITPRDVWWSIARFIWEHRGCNLYGVVVARVAWPGLRSAWAGCSRIRDDVIALIIPCCCRVAAAEKIKGFSLPRMRVRVENYFAGSDTLRISATTLHCRTLESLCYRLVKSASSYRSVLIEIIRQRNNITDRRTGRHDDTC